MLTRRRELPVRKYEHELWDYPREIPLGLSYRLSPNVFTELFRPPRG